MSKSSKSKSSRRLRRQHFGKPSPSKIQPSPDTSKQEGIRLCQQGSYAAAQTALEKAAERTQNDHEIHEWLAQVHMQQNQFPQARKSLAMAQEIEPDSLKLHILTVKFESESGNHETALALIERLEASAPEEPSVLAIKAESLCALHRYEEAKPLFERLTALDKKNYRYWNNAGNLYRDLGQLEQAEAHYAQAIELAGSDAVPYANYLTLLHYGPHVSRERLLEVCREWQQRYSPEALSGAAPTRPPGHDLRPGRCLRIGLFSDGFRQHPVGNMITAALEQLPGEEFKLFAYSSSTVSDRLTRRLKARVHSYSYVGTLSDDAFEARIAEDRIDILIELAGFNTGTRMRVIAQRPAPLIVKWVGGLINTTGVEAIDYLLSDSIETPPGEDAFYTEKLIRMPDDYICFEPPVNFPVTKPLPAQRNGHLTLGCFNNPTKLNEVLLDQWAQLLHTLPDAKLLLQGRPFSGADFKQRLIATMAAHGIGAERLIIEGPLSHFDLLATYNRVDIALDTWPYSGGLTTCEALLMGVPVVTLPGPTFAGRHSATHLINAGLPELVTSDWDQYRARVIDLASDLDSLATIRKHLRQIMLASPLCDAPRFAGHLSVALRGIWQRHCEGQSPAALTFDKSGEARFEDSAVPLSLAPFEVDAAAAEAVDKTPGETKAETADETQDEFQWRFQGKLIAVDHGGQLLHHPAARKLLMLHTLELVAFDPTSHALDTSLQGQPGVHYYPNMSLGDGRPATHYACLDPALSATLPPLPAEVLSEQDSQGSQVLAKLPINSLALDSINGLTHIDWLVLDAMHDTATILENGCRILEDALLIQAHVAFQPTHERQTSLADLQQWASQNGFRFYWLYDQANNILLPESILTDECQAAELISADALLLPSPERTAQLDDNQRMKLAFLLHTVYGIKDASCALFTEQEQTGQYLRKRLLPAEQPVKPAPLRSNGEDNWKAVVLGMLSSNVPLQRKPHGLPNRLVVSLTSYPERFATLPLTLKSLTAQTVRPDRLILWIAHSDKQSLTRELLDFEQQGVEIRYCEDLKSYKKIIPALNAFPTAYIATADDDLYYWPTWLEELIKTSNINEPTISAHRIHRIRFNDKGLPLSYKDWEWNYSKEYDAHEHNFATGVGGVLYPPNCFHQDVTCQRLLLNFCPHADDVWLYWMARLAGYKFKPTGSPMTLTIWPGSQERSLFATNIMGGNDQQISKMVDRYGVPCTQNSNVAHPRANKLWPTKSKDFSISNYWEARYKHGGNSGAGSYGRLSHFKAEVINHFIAEKNIQKMIEFGCGDGNQAGMFTSIQYLGIDISTTAINVCKKKFIHDKNKTFMTPEEYRNKKEKSDLSISLDVIYHLVNDDDYHDYMCRLFDSTCNYCIVYSANVEEITPDIHVRKRKFTDWVDANASEWRLEKHIPNRYPMKNGSDPHNTSFADFYIFKKNRLEI